MNTIVTRRVGFAAVALMTVFANGCAELEDTFGSESQHGAVVTGPTVSTTSSITVGSPVVVDYAGLSGEPTDWITIAREGDAAETYLYFQYTEGGTTGQATFAAPNLTPGDYEVRAYNNWEGTQSYAIAASADFTVTAAAAAPIATDNNTYGVGAPIVVTYSGMPGTSTDWLALAVSGSANNSFVTYQYTGGATSGTATFSGLPAGSYVARSFAENSFELVAESSAFLVGNVVSTSQTTYDGDQSIVVNWAGLDTDATNWIALATAGSPSNSYVAYVYTGGASNGTHTFAALPAGSYEARAFLHNGYTLAGSSSFTVSSGGTATVTSDAPTYTEGQTVTISYANLSGNAQDWVGIAVAGSADTSYVRYAYVNGTGMEAFSGLTAGTYEARLYSNDTFTVIDRVTFEITSTGPVSTVDVSTAATVSTGSPAEVTFSGLTSDNDWIGISAAGSADTEYLQYSYPGTASGTASFTGLPAGTYEVRAYLNNTFEVADRQTFTVADPV